MILWQNAKQNKTKCSSLLKNVLCGINFFNKRKFIEMYFNEQSRA